MLRKSDTLTETVQQTANFVLDPAGNARFLSVPEVAKLLGISRALAYALIKSGHLPGIKLLGSDRIVVSQQDLRSYLESGRITTAS